MKIAKKKVRIQSPLVNPIIDLERLFEDMLKNGGYKAIKFHNTPGDYGSGYYETNIPYNGGGLYEEWLVWKAKLLKGLDGQSISTGPQRHMYTKRLLTSDAKPIFNQAAQDIGIHTVDNSHIVLLEMTKHACPAHILHKQKRYLRRHRIKPRSMKLHTFIRRLQELNAY